jgi:ATPase subunit of ABC transporter with duplicated ATPase domains
LAEVVLFVVRVLVPLVQPDVFIFKEPIDFDVTCATRCGVMGPNGAGKSTMLKILVEQNIPTTGKLYKHPKFVMAYFGQYSTHGQ